MEVFPRHLVPEVTQVSECSNFNRHLIFTVSIFSSSGIIFYNNNLAVDLAAKIQLRKKERNINHNAAMLHNHSLKQYISSAELSDHTSTKYSCRLDTIIIRT